MEDGGRSDRLRSRWSSRPTSAVAASSAKSGCSVHGAGGREQCRQVIRLQLRTHLYIAALRSSGTPAGHQPGGGRVLLTAWCEARAAAHVGEVVLRNRRPGQFEVRVRGLKGRFPCVVTMVGPCPDQAGERSMATLLGGKRRHPVRPLIEAEELTLFEAIPTRSAIGRRWPPAGLPQRARREVAACSTARRAAFVVLVSDAAHVPAEIRAGSSRSAAASSQFAHDKWDYAFGIASDFGPGELLEGGMLYRRGAGDKRARRRRTPVV